MFGGHAHASRSMQNWGVQQSSGTRFAMVASTGLSARSLPPMETTRTSRGVMQREISLSCASSMQHARELRDVASTAVLRQKTSRPRL